MDQAGKPVLDSNNRPVKRMFWLLHASLKSLKEKFPPYNRQKNVRDLQERFPLSSEQAFDLLTVIKLAYKATVQKSNTAYLHHYDHGLMFEWKMKKLSQRYGILLPELMQLFDQKINKFPLGDPIRTHPQFQQSLASIVSVSNRGYDKPIDLLRQMAIEIELLKQDWPTHHAPYNLTATEAVNRTIFFIPSRPARLYPAVWRGMPFQLLKTTPPDAVSPQRLKEIQAIGYQQENLFHLGYKFM